MIVMTWRRALGAMGVLAVALSGCMTTGDVGVEGDGEREGTLGRIQQAGGTPPCKRWMARQINPCWGIVANDICHNEALWDNGEPDGPQHHNYNKWLYSSTPEQACEKFAKKYGKYIGKNLLPTAIQLTYIPDPNGGGGTIPAAFCYATNNEFRQPFLERTPLTGYLTYETVQRESCCSRKPLDSNRYKNVAGPAMPQAGGDFTKATKLAIKEKNQSDFNIPLGNNTVTTDLGSQDYGHDLVWYKGAYAIGQQPVPGNDDPEPDPPAGLPTPDVWWPPYAANVDHIVPRIDTHGCPCGTNSPANALIISERLNKEMSNRCSHPDRQTILQNFTSP